MATCSLVEFTTFLGVYTEGVDLHTCSLVELE